MTSLRVYYCALLPWIAPCNGIQEDSLGFWIPYHGFQLPGSGFQSLVGFQFFSWILDSKAQDSRFHGVKISRNQESGFMADLELVSNADVVRASFRKRNA